VKDLSVLEKAKELCLAIRESTEFKNFQDAKEQLLANPEAKERMERYLQLVEQAQQAEKEGRELTLEEKDDLKRVSSMISFYTETARFSAMQQTYYKMIRQVYEMIQATSENRPLPECSGNQEKGGQCTGSCQDCGLG